MSTSPAAVRSLPQAQSLVSPELLAGCSGAPIELARHFLDGFFGCVADVVSRGRVVVLEEVALGADDPLLREVVAAVDLADRDEAPWWYDADGDDVDLWRLGPVRPWCVTVDDLHYRDLLPPFDDIAFAAATFVALLVTFDRLLADIAPYARVGDAVIRRLGPHHTVLVRHHWPP